MFRQDLGEPASIEDLEELSRKKRSARLDAIKETCRGYIHGPLAAELAILAERAMERAGQSPDRFRIEPDIADPDGQSLLLWYPSVADHGGGYIQPAVKIESGGKSALDPNAAVTVKPYIGEDVSGLDLSVSNVTTVDPVRTFWDKVVILHGLSRWFGRRGELRGGGKRVSRHYYDIHRLFHAEIGQRAALDRDMGNDCVRHARMFFDRPDLDLASAVPGMFQLTPHADMIAELRRDYNAMSTMIFGVVPAFDDILESCARLERKVNAGLD